MNQPLPAMPARIAKLPRDHRGFPIPWFVATLDDGSRDFRIADARKHVRATQRSLCWVCGEPLGRYQAFPIGPMCLVNRVTSEPPCHRECAEFSVRACPFLTRPRMRRNDKDLPDGHSNPGGVMIERNPGVTCLYITQGYRRFRSGDGVLIKLDPPVELSWWREGRAATRDEVRDAIDSGYPLLLDIAREQGGDAVIELGKMLKSAIALTPVE